MKSIAYVGMDVHQDHIVGAILPVGSDEPIVERKIKNDSLTLKKWIAKWEKEYILRCCYEASSCGYVVQRWLADMGVDCDVIAPSLIPIRPGEKIKTDPRDARKLAKLHRAGELVSVHVPSKEDESERGLIRCRETMQREVLTSKHYVLKFLSVRGLVYRGKSNWTKKHWEYLRAIKFEGPDDISYREYLTMLEFKLERLSGLDRQIEGIASSDKYKEIVGRLASLKGIGVLTAMIVASEVQDFRRFKGPRELMSYLGLVPGEKSSGETRKLGGITKTGNSRVRRVLVESAWNYQHKPAVTEGLKKRHVGQSAEVIAYSWKAQHRLYKKFWGIANRKERCKAAVAVARELAGFIWGLATQFDSAGRMVS